MNAILLFTLIASLIHSQSSQGKWDVIGSGGNVCIHTAVLPNLRLLCLERPHLFPYPINPFSNGLLESEIILNGSVSDSGDWKSTWVSKPTIRDAFCGGHAMLGNGSILVIGGDNQSMSRPDGTKYIIDGRRARRVYDPCPPDSSCIDGGQWGEPLPDMNIERWYPTVVTTKNGNTIIFSGTLKNLDFDNLGESNNPTYEYWPAKDGPWPRVLDILNWAFPHNTYPMAFQLPSGGVFLFVSNKTVIIDPETDEISNKIPDMPVMDHAPWIYPHSPTMTMLPLSKKNGYKSILQVCGGSKLSSKAASPMCWTINPDDDQPQWVQVDDMPHGRLMPDSILLPDGKILYVNGAGSGQAGGNSGQVQYASDPVFAADLYDPEAPAGKRWKTLASASVARMYHSEAALIETGHVISVGSEMKNYVDYYPNIKANCWPTSDTPCTDPFEYRIERFTPPYLLTGKARPIIASAPSHLTYNSTFIIDMTSPSSDVDRVTFIRYSTVTHQTNTDQRFIELEILAKKGNQIYLSMPPNSAIAPPGNWFIFALSKGVPSVAKTINLNSGDATFVEIPSSNSNSNSSHSVLQSYALTILSWMVLLFVI